MRLAAPAEARSADRAESVQEPRGGTEKVGKPLGATKRLRKPWWPLGVDSDLEMALLTRLEHAGLPLGVGQYRIVPGRQFVWDRCWPDRMVCVEVNGGIWIKSGHTTGKGIQRDCLKASMAAALGWRCLPLTAEMIESGQAVELIAQALEIEIAPAGTGGG